MVCVCVCVVCDVVCGVRVMWCACGVRVMWCACVCDVVCVCVCRTLVTILQESQSPVAIAVAAHDLGEYVRYYPRGKR